MQDAIDIKVLQTLGMARETLSHARGASEGPRPTGKAALKHGEGQAIAPREGAAFFHRSAGPVNATLSDL